MTTAFKQRLRSVVRNLLVAVGVLLTAPLWGLVRLLAPLDRKDNVLLSCAECLSLVPGLPGIFLRRGYYLMTLESFAADCTVEFGSWFAHRRTSVGRGVYIGGRCTLGMCVIGDDAMLGSNVDVIAGRYTHGFTDLDMPIAKQPELFEPIRIGRNSWIGNSAVVMADIGDDVVIGAGSVVVKKVPAGSVAAGNPCTVKKSRYQSACSLTQ